MNITLCSRCPKPAFLRVDSHTVLCAECWNEITDRLKSDFESQEGILGETAAIETKPPNPTVAAVTSFDDGIPEFLRRAG